MIEEKKPHTPEPPKSETPPQPLPVPEPEPEPDTSPKSPRERQLELAREILISKEGNIADLHVQESVHEAFPDELDLSRNAIARERTKLGLPKFRAVMKEKGAVGRRKPVSPKRRTQMPGARPPPKQVSPLEMITQQVIPVMREQRLQTLTFTRTEEGVKVTVYRVHKEETIVPE